MSDEHLYEAQVALYARIFEEWQRRWQENPSWFKSHDEHFAKPPKTYGEAAARYFLALDRELPA